MTSRLLGSLSRARRAVRIAGTLGACLLLVPFTFGSPATASVSSGSTSAQVEKRGDPALAPCRMKPTNRNTGAEGELRRSGRTVLGDGARLRDARVASLRITGTDVKVTNVRVDGNVLVTGDKVRLKRVTAKHIGLSSAVDVVVARANIGYGGDDGIHVTSDGNRLVRRVSLRYNFIHHPKPPPGSHYDGTQVRGADNLVIRCSTYRAGPFQDTFNANIYLENANGGVSRVTVARNWLAGSAWGVMVSAKSASFIRNRFSGDIHWGFCYLSPGSGTIETRGNIAVPEGRQIDLCGKD